MKKLLLFMLLFAATAHAGTWTYDSHKPGTQTAFPCDVVQPYANGGITATFGAKFSYCKSIDAGAYAYCPTEYKVWSDDASSPIGAFDIDAQHGSEVLSFGTFCPSGGDPVAAATITFSVGVKRFECDLAGVMYYNFLACYPWVFSDDYGYSWGVHAHGYPPGSDFGQGSIGLNANVQAFDANGNPVLDPIYLQYVDAYCPTDPPNVVGPPFPPNAFNWDPVKTPYCNWQRVVISSATPFRKVVFSGLHAYPSSYAPIYIDNLWASTLQCQNPPCQIERAEQERRESAPPVLQAGSDPSARSHGVMMLNTVTGERRTLHTTDAKRTTWGGLKVIYR